MLVIAIHQMKNFQVNLDLKRECINVASGDLGAFRFYMKKGVKC
uniref:Uncharacterized protein n=1 Tax=Rhizophora mucronata TaxID=61149 RepID=A0A2P2IHI6_RHIMU